MVPSDPQGPWFLQTWIYISSESFHINMSSSGSVLEKIFRWPHPVFTFLWLSLLCRRSGPLLKKVVFPLPKDDLYQVWLNLAHWFWRRNFLKIFSVFLLFCFYLPLEKRVPLHLNTLESPLSKDNLCQVWLKLALWFWRSSRKCRSLQTDGQRVIRN
jgi:hypothetical protein